MERRVAFSILAAVLAIVAVAFLLRESGPPVSPSPLATPGESRTPLREIDIEPVQGPVADSTRVLAESDVPPRPADASEPGSTREERRGIVLSGTVNDAQGSSLGREMDAVSLTDPSGNVEQASCEAGGYSFHDVNPGDYVLSCWAWGYHSAERRITLRPEESEHREDFVLEPSWMIDVHIVTPDGEDLRSLLRNGGVAPGLQLSVIATREPPGERLRASMALERNQATLGRSRDFRAAGENRDDRMEVFADPPIHVSVALRDTVLATQRVEVLLDEITFVIDLDRIRDLLSGLVLRVTDADTGAPATDAWVMLMTAQSTERAVSPDAEGRVSYERRVPGLYDVFVHSGRHAPLNRRVELVPGQVTDLGTIGLQRGFSLRGRCIDVEGRPHQVEGNLEPHELASGSSDSGQFFVFRLPVQRDGSFVVKQLMPGRYIARVRSENRDGAATYRRSWIASPVVVDLREGSVEDLTIVVHSPVPLILRPAGQDVAGLEFDVITPEGLSCWESGFSGAAPQRQELAPGTYTLRLSRDRRAIREQAFTLDSSPLTLDIAP